MCANRHSFHFSVRFRLFSLSLLMLTNNVLHSHGTLAITAQNSSTKTINEQTTQTTADLTVSAVSETTRPSISVEVVSVELVSEQSKETTKNADVKTTDTETTDVKTMDATKTAPVKVQDKDKADTQVKDKTNAQDKSQAKDQGKDQGKSLSKDKSKDKADTQVKDKTNAQDKSQVKDQGKDQDKTSSRLSRAALWRKAEASPAVVLARQKWQQAKAELERTQNWRFSLNSSTSFGQNPSQKDLNSDFSSGLRMEYSGLSGSESAQQANIAFQRAQYQLFRAHLNEWRQRATAWNSLAMAQVRVNISATELQIAKLKLQRAQSRLEQGAATEYQVRAAKIDLQQAELSFAQGQVSLKQARTELGFLGIQQTRFTVGTWQALPVPKVARIRFRQDVLEAELNLEQTQMTLDKARHGIWPTWNANAKYNLGKLSLAGSIDNRLNTSLNTDVNWTNKHDNQTSWLVGVNANVNLDGHALRQVKIHEQNVKSAKLGLARSRKRAEQDIAVKREAVRAAMHNLTLTTESLWAQQELERVNTKRKEQGLISQLAWLEHRTATMKSIQSVTEARKQVDLATLSLWEAYGWHPDVSSTPVPSAQNSAQPRSQNSSSSKTSRTTSKTSNKTNPSKADKTDRTNKADKTDNVDNVDKAQTQPKK